METLKYKVIKTEDQYDAYCERLEAFLISDQNGEVQDEIELLTLLIETWDHKHNTFDEQDPIEVLKSLMDQNHLKAKGLVEITDLSKGMVSKILNYQKGLSKESIRKLAEYFKVSQEAFNREYQLQHIPVTSSKKCSKHLCG